MKTDDLEAFIAVVRCQSLSLAADSLHLTQSAITRRVQSFEEELGVELFDRNTRPLKPTAMGLRVYQQSRDVLQAMAQLRDLVDDQMPPTGTLRLGIPQSLGDAVLLETLAQLKARYPALHTQVFSGWGNSLLEKLENLELEAMAALFPVGRRFPEGLIGRRLTRVRLCVVAAKHSSLPRPKQLADSYPRGWVLNPDGCGFRAGLQQALQAQGLKLSLNLETFGTELQLGLVARDMGLGLVPEPLLQVSRYRDQLVRLALTDFQPEVELCLVYPRGIGNLSEAIEVIGDLIAQQLA